MNSKHLYKQRKYYYKLNQVFKYTYVKIVVKSNWVEKMISLEVSL